MLWSQSDDVRLRSICRINPDRKYIPGILEPACPNKKRGRSDWKVKKAKHILHAGEYSIIAEILQLNCQYKLLLVGDCGIIMA